MTDFDPSLLGETADTFLTIVASKADESDSDTAALELSAPAPRSSSAPATRSFSILDFDPHNPSPITEPASTRAMQNRGIAFHELVFPTREVDPDVKDLFLAFHEERISRLIAQIKEERARIVNLVPRQSQTAKSSGMGSAVMSPEEKQLQRITRQQQRELQTLVQTVLRSERMRTDAAMKAERAQEVKREAMNRQLARTAFLQERHLEKLREHAAAEAELEKKRQEKIEEGFERDRQRLITLQKLAEAKRRKLQAQEASRVEQADRNRMALERVEMERARRLAEKALQEEQRALALMLEQEKEAERRKQESREHELRKKEVLQGIRSQEEEQLAKLKHDCEKHEMEREVFLDKLHEKQAHNRAEAHDKEEEKVERFLQQRERIEDEVAQERMKSIINEEIARDRLAMLEQQKERERKRQAFSLLLKKEERDMNAEHLARLRELKVAEAKQKMITSEERIDFFARRREQVQEERRLQMVRLERQKEALAQGFQAQIAAGKGSPEAVLKVAQQWGIVIHDSPPKPPEARPQTVPI
jgi:hypothetical protein